ncbi:MAG: M12 family metallopeptidase [Acidobacteriota bacterium]
MWLFPLLLNAAVAARAQEAPADWQDLRTRTSIWRGLPVEYKVWDGWALVEGDILLGRVEEVEPAPGAPRPKLTRNEASVISPRQYRWPDGVIPYVISETLPDPERAREAIRHWQEQTPLKFVEWSGERNYVTFRPAYSGCSSNVGMIGGQQVVNLGPECTVASAVHEIGHTAGLWHTQSRIDRDRYLQVLFKNLDKREWPQYRQHISDGQDVGPYDYGSIMHYGRTGFSRNQQPTQETVPPGIPIGQRQGLSPEDIQAVLWMYGQTPEQVTLTTTPPGLKIVVDGVAYISPQRFRWSAGEQHVIAMDTLQADPARPNTRYVFARWSDGGERERQITVSGSGRVWNAQFSEQARFRHGASPAQAGTVEISPASEDGYYPVGTRLRLRASPGDGFQFLRWTAGEGGVIVQGSNGLGASANPSTITLLRDDLHYIARFTAAPVIVIASEPPGRSVTVDGQRLTAPEAFEWAPGSSHTLEAASPQAGAITALRYRFVGWSNGGAPAQTVTASAQSSTLTVIFQPQYAVSTRTDWLVNAASPTRPSADSILISPPSDGSFYDTGTALEFRAVNGEGWQLANWYGDLAGAENPGQATVNDQVVVTANFLSPTFVNGSAVVHDASRQPGPVSPGQLVTIFHPELGPATPVDAAAEGTGLPTTLAGLRVLFDGVPAPLVRLTREQVRVQAPWSVAGQRTVELVLEAAGQRAASQTIGVLDRNPALYTADGSGRGQGLIVHEDGSANSAENPAPSGAQVRLLATGLGETEPASADGQAVAEARPRLPVSVLINEAAAELLSVEPARGHPPGVFSVLVRIPEGAGAGGVPVFLASDGKLSPPGVTIALR